MSKSDQSFMRSFSLLIVGLAVLTLLLIEKLKLAVMSEIWSRHLSFGSVARRCV